MPISQHDFNRVNSAYIQPMTRHFNKKLSDEQTEAYVEDLSIYQEDVLKKAALKNRRENKYFPSIADAISACDELKKQEYKSKTVSHYFEKKGEDFYPVAVEIMHTEFGQMALREGWGNDLFVTVKRDGKKDWNNADANRFREAKQRAVEAAAEADKLKGKDHLMMVCMGIWDAMIQKEKDLAMKYLKGYVA